MTAQYVKGSSPSIPQTLRKGFIVVLSAVLSSLRSFLVSMFVTARLKVRSRYLKTNPMEFIHVKPPLPRIFEWVPEMRWWRTYYENGGVWPPRVTVIRKEDVRFHATFLPTDEARKIFRRVLGFAHRVSPGRAVFEFRDGRCDLFREVD